MAPHSEDDESRQLTLNIDEHTDNTHTDNDSQHWVDNELDVQLTGCGATPFCDPTHKCHQFIALLLMCLIGFGSSFCYDNPAALQDNIKADDDLTTGQIMWFYSIYAWPNVVFCLIGGFLLDRVFGIRLGTIIFTTVLLIGQLMFALGGYFNMFWLMIVGRLVFGMGAESLAVAQNNYAVLWFKDNGLNMALGWQIFSSCVGSTANFLIMEPVFKYVNQFLKGPMCTGVVLLLASLACVTSTICALVLGWMDKRAERVLRRNNNQTGQIVQLSDFKTFKTTFWLVSAVCAASYASILPFISLSKVFLMEKYDMAPEDANKVTSWVFIISAVASPTIGFIVDRTGRNVLWLLVGIVTIMFGHGLLGSTYLSPYYGIVFVGLSFAMLAASIWSLIAFIVPNHQLGMAYGICQSFLDLGLALSSMVVGFIVDRYGFLKLEIFFVSWLFFALIATIFIWIIDYETNGILNMSSKQRASHANPECVDSDQSILA